MPLPKRTYAACHPDQLVYKQGRTTCESCYKERRKEESRTYYLTHAQHLKEKSRKEYKEDSVRILERDRWAATLRLYGISQAEYEEMLRKQAGLCAICHKTNVYKHHLSGMIPRLHIDHDHETGRVRGLLCFSCNTKLGWFDAYKDTVEKYLEVCD